MLLLCLVGRSVTRIGKELMADVQCYSTICMQFFSQYIFCTTFDISSVFGRVDFAVHNFNIGCKKVDLPFK